MKRSKKLKLALMGVTPLLLAGCDSSSNKTTLIYKDVDSCAKDGVLDKDSCQYYLQSLLERAFGSGAKI